MFSMKNEAAKTFLMPDKAQYWIEKLELKPHPEGGHFREVYCSDEKLSKDSLPDRFGGDRSFSTSIYYLLQKNRMYNYLYT